MPDDKGRGWHGDPQRHHEAGQKAADTAEERYGEDFHENIGKKGGQAAQQSGHAHQLTTDERIRGGKMSGGNFANDPQRASEEGRKGGKASNTNKEDFFSEEDL